MSAKWVPLEVTTTEFEARVSISVAIRVPAGAGGRVDTLVVYPVLLPGKYRYRVLLEVNEAAE